MNIKTFRRSTSLFRIALATVSAITFAGVAGAQEGKTGKVQQGLVGGSVVSAENQEQYGLVTLSVNNPTPNH